ncbi:MAG: DUF4168 domain-containing protein [Candidimonas sp.]|nr:MAG: DUF4168 domain-containing protein [Candidimonas sp.]
MKTRTIIICTSALAILGGAAAPAMAQQTQTPTPQRPPSTQQAPGQQTPSANYSDSQLKQFVGASQQVAVVVQEYNPKLQATRDETAREKIVHEANEKMIAAVHKEGMSVDEFNTMNQAVRQNPSLMKRAQNIERARGGAQ